MSDMDEVFDQVTLTLDDDSELVCDVIATFPAKVNGKEQMYIALLPADATPESEIFNDLVDSFTLPIIDGRAGVLCNHAPMLAALETGVIVYNKACEVRKNENVS